MTAAVGASQTQIFVASTSSLVEVYVMASWMSLICTLGTISCRGQPGASVIENEAADGDMISEMAGESIKIHLLQSRPTMRHHKTGELPTFGQWVKDHSSQTDISYVLNSMS